MSEELTLSVTVRSDIGKGASRRLRREANKVPAIIYGGGKDPMPVQAEHHKVIKALENEAFYSSILNLDVAGKSVKVVLKALQRHPFKPKIQHMDFLRVTGKEQITMLVPFHFIGEEDAPGCKQGGVATHSMTEVEVKCLPKNLPENIEIDMSNFELDQVIHLADVTLPQGVELTTQLTEDHNPPVASIHTPRVAPMEEEVPAEEEPSEDEAAEGKAGSTEGE